MQVSWSPTARERKKHAAGADFLAALGHGLLQIRSHRPLTMQSADAVEEVFDNLPAEHRVQHFRMELHAVETLFDVFDRGVAAVFGACADAEALGKLRDLDTVAHPVDGGFVHVFKQRAAVTVGQLGLAVFAGLGAAGATAEKRHH